MPTAGEIRRMGSEAFEAVVSRVESGKGAMPNEGISLAAFEAMALSGVSPNAAPALVRALHNRGTIFVRRNRGEARVFAGRPADISGIFDAAGEMDHLLSAIVPHVRRVAAAVAAREAAKDDGDAIRANEARDRLDAAAGRFVGILRSHAARGINADDARRELWALFPDEAMAAIATFEPSLSRKATGSLAETVPPRRRIANGLAVSGKAVALIKKAGASGLTKSDLLQSIRPKVPACELASLLDGLIARGEVKTRSVRVRGTRFATRYFSAS